MPRPSNRRLQRAVGYKKLRTSFLIFTEGETEVIYFSKLRNLLRVGIKVQGLADNTLSLVQKAITFKARHPEYDQTWVVFDRDVFPAVDFNEAIRLAISKEISVAYSNECFELWLLLHLQYVDTGLDRALLAKKLQTSLKSGYDKTAEKSIEELLPRYSSAIENAKRLLSNYVPRRPESDNPSTTVHFLVEEIVAASVR
jgi:hypothetical protein